MATSRQSAFNKMVAANVNVRRAAASGFALWSGLSGK